MMPLDPSDIALFLVSFAACLYCALLSRRLKALQNTKDGLGASIRAMSESVAAVSSARHEAKAQSGEIAVRLTAILTEAHDAGKKLTELKDALEMKDREISRKIQAADAEIRITVRDALAQSSDRVAEITRLTKLERSLTSRIIQGLLTEGLISRRNLPQDARRFGLYITEKGGHVRLKGRAVSDRLETILTEPLSREDLDRLDEILERLAIWVDSSDYQQRLAEQ
mgnify:CR=1 FL=1